MAATALALQRGGNLCRPGGGFRRRTWRVLVLVLLAAAAPAGVSAQSGAPVDVTSPLAHELLTCVEVEDDEARLACFDRIAAPLAQSRAAAEDDAAQVLRGENDADSEVFTMAGPWHVAWNLEGSILTIELRTGAGHLQDVVGNQIGAGEGASGRLGPGDWQLAVRAVGAWQVRIVRD